MSGWTKWEGDKVKRLTNAAISEAVGNAARATLGQSNQQVPLDEDTLLTSGMVKQNPANSMEWTISYGGGPGTGISRVPYAVKWHEQDANFQHGRKKNYLRDPIKTFTPKALKKEIKKALKRTL
jgi:hypothetical protein